MTRLLTNKDSRGTSQNQLLSSIDPSGQGKPLSLGDQDLTVSVIIPARNEKNNLPSVLSRLASDCYEIILVDGHSSDDTVEVAQSLCPGLRVIEQPATGKGDALAAGLRVAKGDVIVFMDADGSNDPAEIPLFVEAIVRGADYAKGSSQLYLAFTRQRYGKHAREAEPIRADALEAVTPCPTYLIAGGLPTDSADNFTQTAPKSMSLAVTKMVETSGLEPPTPCVQSRCSTN